MTPSEKFRLVLIIILIIIYIAKRYDLLGKMRERKKQREQLEAKQRALAERKEQRQQAQEHQAEKKAQTAEILKRGLGARMQQKSAQAAGLEIWYLEGGARPDAEQVLMLHGFAGAKEDWNEVGQQLIDQGYHLVAPDLPGFGQSQKHPELSYDVTSQTKRLRAFAKKVGLERFHLVGHSVGASIAAAIAYAAPQQVSSLTLIEPFGVRVPYESELDKMLGHKRNPMVIATEMAYDNLLGFIYHQPPEVPPALKKLRAEQASTNRVFYLKMWKQVREGERAHLLDLLLPVVKTKTLIVQGAESKVIHPATAGVVEAMMSDARAAVIEECGHFAMVERPRETAEHLLQFFGSLPEPGSADAEPDQASA